MPDEEPDNVIWFHQERCKICRVKWIASLIFGCLLSPVVYHITATTYDRLVDSDPDPPEIYYPSGDGSQLERVSSSTETPLRAADQQDPPAADEDQPPEEPENTDLVPPRKISPAVIYRETPIK